MKVRLTGLQALLPKANEEALKGLKKNSKGKGKATTIIQIAGIVFNPWGLTTGIGRIQTVSKPKAPTQATKDFYIQLGLGFADPAGIPFDTSMSHVELCEFLKERIPIIRLISDTDNADNADSNDSIDSDNGDDVEAIPWGVCNVNGRSLTYAPIDLPDGQALASKRSNITRGFNSQWNLP
ncbi:hypothetical protein MPER_02544, partial [Moniliophthora perniciosa FA553]